MVIYQYGIVVYTYSVCAKMQMAVLCFVNGFMALKMIATIRTTCPVGGYPIFI